MHLERLVQEGPDLLGVANGGYSTYVLTGVLQDELGGRPADPAFAQLSGHQLCVHPGGTTGQNQQGVPVQVEDHWNEDYLDLITLA